MSPTHADEMTALAERFFGAIERGDTEAAAACYHPQAIIWHNDDGLETTPAQNLKVLAGYIAVTSRREYRNRRLFPVEDGFVQQHDLYVVGVNGRVYSLPVCIVTRVEGGLIRRLDEYLDRASVDRWTL